jgi:hypothetical protein
MAIWPSRPSSRWKALLPSLRRLPPTSGGSVLSKFKSPAITAGLFLALERPDVETRRHQKHSSRSAEGRDRGLSLLPGDKNFATGPAADVAECTWRDIRRQNRVKRPAGGESASKVRRNF